MKVAATDASRLKPDQGFVSFGFGFRHILNLNILWSKIDSSLQNKNTTEACFSFNSLKKIERMSSC